MKNPLRIGAALLPAGALAAPCLAAGPALTTLAPGAFREIPQAGVNNGNYTIYFVDWYGRADFKFHVYTKIPSNDPDTGYDFGTNRGSRKIVARGGTPPAGTLRRDQPAVDDVAAVHAGDAFRRMTDEGPAAMRASLLLRGLDLSITIWL